MPHAYMLLNDHERLATLAERLLGITTGQPDPAAAHRALTTLAQELESHLVEEADFAYSDALRRSHAWLHHEVIAFEDEFAQLRARWSDYLDMWTEPRMARDWSTFVDATAWMMAELLRRIDRENAVLYPLVLAAQTITPAAFRAVA